jgi:hypothetical protein
MEGQIKDFQALLDKQGIRYFSAKELFYLGASNADLQLNSIPPRELWTNIIPAAHALDVVRMRLGKPIRILSAYRNEAYNRAIGGERNSFHTRFMALDFTADAPTHELARLAKAVRKDGIFSGGIGIYRSFIHIDCRGYSANWNG